MPRANGITRQEILTSIKCTGAMTAEELARELGISQVAVRQHLSSLEAEGIITVSIERRGLGRPSHRYTLTTQGDEQFPRCYDALANSLLDELLDWQGEETVRELFARRRQRRVASLFPRVKDKPLADKIQEMARIQTEDGYMAEVVEDDTGTIRVVEHNCPICEVARRHSDIFCTSELQFYHEMLGDVEVVREKFILNGDHTCTFRIEPRSANTRPQSE